MVKPTDRKAALGWTLGMLAAAAAVFISLVPPGDRIRVAVAFAIVTPWAVACLFYVLRGK